MFFVVVLAPLLSIETSFFASATKPISKNQQKESCQLLLDYGISSSKCLEKLSNTRLQREKHSVEIACDALVALKNDGYRTAFRCYSENFSKLVTSEDRFGQLNGLKICSLWLIMNQEEVCMSPVKKLFIKFQRELVHMMRELLFVIKLIVSLRKINPITFTLIFVIRMPLVFLDRKRTMNI